MIKNDKHVTGGLNALRLQTAAHDDGEQTTARKTPDLTTRTNVMVEHMPASPHRRTQGSPEENLVRGFSQPLVQPKSAQATAVRKITFDDSEPITLLTGQSLTIELPRNTTIGPYHWDFRSGLSAPVFKKEDEYHVLGGVRMPDDSAANQSVNRMQLAPTGGHTVIESFTWSPEQIDSLIDDLGTKDFKIQALLKAENGEAVRDFIWYVVVQ